jgi:hypothetical protein
MKAPSFGPFAFELTDDEAKVAASRAALRRALAGGLTERHLAPLAAFVLAMAFTAILALTDLVSRRHGEIALLLEAAAFMIHRIATRRRFLRARRESTAALEALRAAGAVEIAADEGGVDLKGATVAAHWDFWEGLEVEDAGGMIYLWPRTGDPAFLPTRIFPSEDAAREFVAFARARTSAPKRSTI